MKRDVHVEDQLRAAVRDIGPSAGFVERVDDGIRRRRHRRLVAATASCVLLVGSVAFILSLPLSPPRQANPGSTAGPSISQSPASPVWPRSDVAFTADMRASVAAAWERMTGRPATRLLPLASGRLALGDTQDVAVLVAFVEDPVEPRVVAYFGDAKTGALFVRERIQSLADIPATFDIPIRWRGRVYALLVASRETGVEANVDGAWRELPVPRGVATLPEPATAWRGRSMSGTHTRPMPVRRDLTGDHGCAVIAPSTLPNGRPAGDAAVSRAPEGRTATFGPDGSVIEAVGRNALGELDPVTSGSEQAVAGDRWQAQVMPIGDADGEVAVVVSVDACDYTFWLPPRTTIQAAKRYITDVMTEFL